MTVAQPAVVTFRIAPRPSLDVVFNAPPEGIANASRSDMVRAVARATRRFTDLRAREAPGVRLDPCFRDDENAPLLCLLRRLRPEFETLRTTAAADDFETLWQRSKAGTKATSDLALLITYAPVLEQDRVVALLLDLKAMARRHFTWSPNSRLSPNEATALNDELFEVGVITQPPTTRDVTNAKEVGEFMNHLFKTSFVEVLTQRGLCNFGGIDAELPLGSEIYINGALAGTTDAPLVKVRDLPAGNHTIRVEHPSYLTMEKELRVAARRTTPLKPTLILAPNQSVITARQALLWTGVVAMAGGAALVVVSFASNDIDDSCVTVNPSQLCPSDLRFKRLGPFLGAPLGLAFFGAGTAWATSVVLNDDDDTYPWWEFIVGIAVGGLVYGVSYLTDPGPANPN